MSSNNQPRFSLDVSINFGIQIAAFIFSSITGILIARTFGPAGKGVYSLILIITIADLTIQNNSVVGGSGTGNQTDLGGNGYAGGIFQNGGTLTIGW